MNRYFYNEGIQMANKHMERYSVSLVIREMILPYKNSYKEKAENKSTGKNMEKWKPLHIAGGNVEWYSHCGK